MELEQARKRLMDLQAELSAYDHAMSLISYDGDTTAPRDTADNRAQTLGILSRIRYELATSAETVSLLESLDAAGEALSGRERRMVYLLLKDIRFMQKIPVEEYTAYQRLVVESQDAWHRAKEASDFEAFRPYLEKMFETARRFAGYAKPGMDPYDFWLNEYEAGLSRAVLDPFFERLRSRIVPLVRKCAAAPQVSDAVIKGDFPEAPQRELAEWLMDTMGLDRGRVGLSTTEHPFTTSLGSHRDERITTHYPREDVSWSMFSVIHEGGHALYDTGSDDDLCYTVLDGGVSMGIHESQSRFYENILGRSRAFIRFLWPKMTALFPEQTRGYGWEDLYRAVNRVAPSLIRTEADEVTYCLHVMIRYELEKRVMAGELAVADLPAEWNRLYRETLGIEVPDDRRGVLQDSHWSFGAIGYFPSYALGSAYGAQFLAKMKETVDVDGAVGRGDFGPVNAWNREHIWRFGSLYEPSELLRRVLGGPFDPEYYLTYLEEKVRDVYGV